MKNLTKRCSMLTAIVAATVLFSGVAPVALAADDAAGQGSVVATRSFPKVSAVKKNILAESTSTEVEQDSDWGGVESLDVPQTKSQAEKDAEERAAAEQQAREQHERVQSAVVCRPIRRQGAVRVRRQHPVRLGLLRFRAVCVWADGRFPAALLRCAGNRGPRGR